VTYLLQLGRITAEEHKHQVLNAHVSPEAIQQALIVGENSGLSTPFDFDDFVRRKRLN
jgi:Bacterial antitoxin of ParD toxin-antitoxin type II system and RHH